MRDRSLRRRLIDGLEAQLYCLLQLPPEPKLVWDDTVRDAKLWQVEHRAWWLALPWYGHVADRFMLAVNRAGGSQGATQRMVRKALNRVDHMRASRALARARSLVYTSSYIHDPDRAVEIEGYFDFGRGLAYGLTIHSLESFSMHARFQWESGTVDHLYVYPFGDDVVVPTRTIKPDQVAEVLRRWYADRFDWKWGHWSQREEHLPYFEVRLEWHRRPSRRRRLWSWLMRRNDDFS